MLDQLIFSVVFGAADAGILSTFVWLILSVPSLVVVSVSNGGEVAWAAWVSALVRPFIGVNSEVDLKISPLVKDFPADFAWEFFVLFGALALRFLKGLGRVWRLARCSGVILRHHGVALLHDWLGVGRYVLKIVHLPVHLLHVVGISMFTGRHLERLDRILILIHQLSELSIIEEAVEGWCTSIWMVDVLVDGLRWLSVEALVSLNHLLMNLIICGLWLLARVRFGRSDR